MAVCVIFIFLIVVLFIVCIYKKLKIVFFERDCLRENNYKNRINFNMAVKLLYDIQNNHQIVNKMKAGAYLNIAVYGMGAIGRSLVKELMENGIKVSYAIDQNAELIYADVPVYNTKDTMQKVDAIVVTTIYDYEQIKDFIGSKVNCPIISLNDFLM